MLRRTILMGLLLIPSLAGAEELELELGASMEYDSNVFRTQQNEDSDGIFRLLPAATLYRDQGDLRYRLRYAMPFEQGIQYGDQISDFDYILNLTSFWALDEANEFFFNNTFRDDRSVTRRFQTDQDVPDISSRRERVISNDASLGLNHAFTARTTGGASVNYALWDTDQVARQDNQTFSATTDLNYALNQTNQIGTGFTFTLQDFQQGGGVPASQTYFYNLFGSWVYQFDEVTTFSISAGPTFIQSDQDAANFSQSVPLTPTASSGGTLFAFLFDTCGLVNGIPVLTGGCDPFPAPAGIVTTEVPVDFGSEVPPGSLSSTDITAFGNAQLTRRWTPTISSTLAYRRQQSNASGLGGSTILDAVTAETAWQIDQWWDAELRFDFAARQSLGDTTQTFLVVQEGLNGEAIVVQPGDTPPTSPAGQGLTAEVSRNAIDSNRWAIGGRLARQIGRRAEASLRLSYNQQFSSQGTRGAPSDYDVFFAIFGVRYRFEPITLW